MQVKVHALPDRRVMVGGLAYDAVHQCVWLGLGNSHVFVTRFDLGTNVFVAESAAAQLEGWSYVHHSLVPMLDGRLYLGVSWVLGAKPRPEKPGPLLIAALPFWTTPGITMMARAKSVWVRRCRTAIAAKSF